MDYPQLFSLSGKVAVVTGAGHGLGKGYALALAGAGAVVACVGRSSDKLRETVEQIKKSGGNAIALTADIARLDDIQSTMQAVVDEFGRLDILVNNAGTEIPKGIVEVTPEDYDTIMAVNLKGLYFASQAAVKYMIPTRQGKIINAGSLASQIGLAEATVYSASKGGVLQFTKALAVEMAAHNIQVNAIGPGYFRTQMTESFFQDEEHNKWIANRIPAGRIGTTDDLAGAVIFLASPASDYITGQIIYVDGGWLAS
ncbi:SDR family NAD(P)-dependent oxidoreductase [Sporomusa sp. KB1]|jgi:NAD(P)-dependent dehydrogenase (short-subunit alcohol dehydrogenase family)|uniref:SDR family NAD(P)-dependent oxidoreductase n=1 Tax=Sporomusa sp. KB1 TaxID=943346 RepID=UPI0011A4C936|nr:glucose 1-dehydrogenase [Sporomusa sp. KB1]TWH46253.1 gluconate 5-dehydrogenase/2-deoxy-D-gluconate 3-dehydrogenase [Sporomusa sp. KB1]